MKKFATAVGLALVTLVRAGPARAQDNQDAAALVDKADMIYRGKTSAALFDMVVKTRTSERTYKIVTWSQQDDEEDRVLIKVLGPALWRGFGTLKIGNSLKLYDPKSNHVTVVSHSMLGDSWMGSHFSNDDLVKETRLARDYRVKPLSATTRDSELGTQVTYHTLELRPKPRAPVVWGRVVYELWSHGDAAIPVKVAYFRKPGDRAPTRTIRFSNVREFDGKLAPAQVEVTVADKPGEFTRVAYESIKLGARIPARKFTEQALRN